MKSHWPWELQLDLRLARAITLRGQQRHNIHPNKLSYTVQNILLAPHNLQILKVGFSASYTRIISLLGIRLYFNTRRILQVISLLVLADGGTWLFDYVSCL